MKIAAIAFFALLVYAHVVGGLEATLPRPLSMFRDGEFVALGYAMFCALAVVGIVYSLTLLRLAEPIDAANAGAAIVVLLIVAATPSNSRVHVNCAFILLSSVFAYNAILLYQAAQPLMLVHLCVPIVLVVVIGFHSYGVWQKTMISYFVIAAVVHHHVLVHAARVPAATEPDVCDKQRPAHRVEQGREWRRNRD